MVITREEAQRAGDGHYVDDGIVHGMTRAGQLAVLEIQVKRTITFSPTDAVFRDVVRQLARASGTLDGRHCGNLALASNSIVAFERRTNRRDRCLKASPIMSSTH